MFHQTKDRPRHQVSFSSNSYAQRLEVLCDPGGEIGSFRIQVRQLDMDVSEGFLEVEVFVFLFWRNAYIAAGGEAPVVRFKVVASHKLYEAIHIAQFCFGKAFLQPVCMPMKIANQFKLLDGCFSNVLDGFCSGLHFLIRPNAVLLGSQFFLGELNRSGK